PVPARSLCGSPVIGIRPGTATDGIPVTGASRLTREPSGWFRAMRDHSILSGTGKASAAASNMTTTGIATATATGDTMTAEAIGKATVTMAIMATTGTTSRACRVISAQAVISTQASTHGFPLPRLRGGQVSRE